jgi:hypothetical protein
MQEVFGAFNTVAPFAEGWSAPLASLGHFLLNPLSPCVNWKKYGTLCFYDSEENLSSFWAFAP